MVLYLFMLRRPPKSTRAYIILPYPTLVRVVRWVRRGSARLFAVGGAPPPDGGGRVHDHLRSEMRGVALSGLSSAIARAHASPWTPVVAARVGPEDVVAVCWSGRLMR